MFKVKVLHLHEMGDLNGPGPTKATTDDLEDAVMLAEQHNQGLPTPFAVEVLDETQRIRWSAFKGKVGKTAFQEFDERCAREDKPVDFGKLRRAVSRA